MRQISNNPMKYQDILDENFVQEGIKLIDNQKKIDMFNDFYYSRIIEVMRERSMTIKEITEKLNLYLKEEGRKRGLKNEKIEQKFRSEKSMYRYIKDLEKAGFVTLSGHRVVFGKTVTEKLYARTAEIFYMATRTSDWWKGEQGHIIMSHVAKLFSLIYDVKNPDVECLKKLMYWLSRMEAALLATTLLLLF